MMTKILIMVFIVLMNNTKSDLEIKCEELIYSHFNSNIVLQKIKFTIPPEIKSKIEKQNRQRFYKDFIYVWKIYDDGNFTAVAMLDNVYGKSMPITFLSIVDEKGVVISTEIVKYREPYGGAVQEESWLRQFKGRNGESSFEVGRDINTISGATISVNSVSTGIKKLVMLYALIKDSI